MEPPSLRDIHRPNHPTQENKIKIQTIQENKIITAVDLKRRGDRLQLRKNA